MRRIKGVIQLLVAVGIIGLIIWANVIPDEGRRIEDSVYVDDAQVLPENEGKRVIIAGKVTMGAPVVDPNLDITFDTLVARRVVERLKYIDGWSWAGVYDYDTTTSFTDATFAGEASIGQFTLDPELVRRLTGGERDWEEDDLDGDTAACLEQDWNFLYDGGQLYITQAPSFLLDWEYPLYDDFVGKLRVRYRLWREGDDYEATVVGIQTGSTLTYDPDLNASSTFEGILDAEEVVASNSRSTLIGMIVCGGIPAVLLLVFGVRNVLDL